MSTGRGRYRAQPQLTVIEVGGGVVRWHPRLGGS